VTPERDARVDDAEQALRAELNAIVVSLEDLLRARDAVHALPENGRGVRSRIAALQTLWPNLTPKARARKIQAIDYRLGALAALVEEGLIAGWVYPASADGTVPVSEAVWLAAAEQPLVWKDGTNDVTFDTDALRRRALELALADGGSVPDH
jgi:hypothetical protein